MDKFMRDFGSAYERSNKIKSNNIRKTILTGKRLKAIRLLVAEHFIVFV